MKYNITGYSTALFSTWYFIEELGILFDAGDGLTSALLQKARKIKNVFISHADRDHLTGLLQFNQLNARDGFPVIHYPKDSGSFAAIENFSKSFDPHVKSTIWKPVAENEEFKIKDDIIVQAIKNNHLKVEDGISKSLSYKIYQVKTKLKPGILALSQEKIRELVAIQGKEKITTEIRTNIITYSGDTPIDNYEKWDNSKILIHEATFLGGKEGNKTNAHGKHSNLNEVIKMVSEITVEKLILGHFSSRYSAIQIDQEIKKLCTEYKIKIPVYRILPGQTHRDILNEEAIN